MNKNGSKWITRERRLSLYLRDNLSCVYCGRGILDNVLLTLDHVVSRQNGGTHHSSNLVTCCMGCNGRKQTNEIAPEYKVIVEYQTGKDITEYLTIAKMLIKDHGYTRSLVELRNL